MFRIDTALFVMVSAAIAAVMLPEPVLAQQPPDARDYRVVATSKTSTMQKEMNEAADGGYRFEKTMGGSSMFGGSEVISIMSKSKTGDGKAQFEYRLLATSKTGTMQKELQEAGDAGFEYRDQTVFGSTFGGDEVVVILERDRETAAKRYEYKLLSTNKTSTMQKELQEVGEAGFTFVGVTVSKTAFGGKELVTILRRPVTP